MSKFGIGEIVEYIGETINPKFPYFKGDHVTITLCGPGLPSISMDGSQNKMDYYVDGGKGLGAVRESHLRKLPPDSTEDPGLTRLKKLLLQDSKKEREHESA